MKTTATNYETLIVLFAEPIRLMKSIAVEFVRRFASTNINKVMTIEASGIAPAIMVGYLLELTVVFAKKKKPVTMENMLTTSAVSYTHLFTRPGLLGNRSDRSEP